MKPQTIFYITPFPHIGGGETSLIYLTQHLNRYKYMPYVVVPKEGQVSARLKNLGINYAVVPFSPFSVRLLFLPGLSPASIIRLYQVAKKVRPALIHLNHPSLSIYGGIIGRLLHIPVLATSHGEWDSVYWYQDLIHHLSLNRIIAITPEIYRVLNRRNLFRKSQVSTIFLGVDTVFFNPESNKRAFKLRLGLNPRRPVITMACRFDTVKNHLEFLQVATIVSKTIPDITFVIAGDPQHDLDQPTSTPLRVYLQLQNYLNKYPFLASRVIFTSYQTDMRPIYGASDIICSTSLSETLPMTFMEAQSCGLPITTYILPSLHHLVTHRQNGFLVPIHHVDELANRLLTLIQNRKLRRQFGRFSRQLVLKKFKITRYVSEIEALYQLLIQKR